MAVLKFFTGTMDCGKSTLALQMDYNHTQRGLAGRVLSKLDRAGDSRVSSRLGLEVEAIEVVDDFDFYKFVIDELSTGGRIDYLVCDEAHFYSRAQIDQLARIVDELGIDVFAFGILTDFRTMLFEASARLVELADHIQSMQAEALCWCGQRATHNARVLNGEMITEGDVIVQGDTVKSDGPKSELHYEVLCRRHHNRRETAKTAKAPPLSPDVLPLN